MSQREELGKIALELVRLHPNKPLTEIAAMAKAEWHRRERKFSQAAEKRIARRRAERKS